MSKIGKRAILLLLALPIGFNVMAQETKKPTLEELIPGGESYRYASLFAPSFGLKVQKTCTGCNGGATNVSSQE